MGGAFLGVAWAYIGNGEASFVYPVQFKSIEST